MLKRAYISGINYEYRYALYRIWQEEKPKVLFIMLNPSTADSTADDPTIRRCMRFAGAWGYGGLYVCNLFAFRSTDPDKLKMAADPVGPQNDSAILQASEFCDKVVFAWGTKGGLMNRDKAIIKLFPNSYCLELTKDGHPKHPLFVKSDVKLIKFNS